MGKTKPHPVNNNSSKANQCNVDSHVGCLTNQSHASAFRSRVLQASGIQPTLGSKFPRRSLIFDGRQWRPSRRSAIHSLPPADSVGRVKISAPPKNTSSRGWLFHLGSLCWVCMFFPAAAPRSAPPPHLFNRFGIDNMTKIEIIRFEPETIEVTAFPPENEFPIRSAQTWEGLP